MANNLTSNPLVIDTAGGSAIVTKQIRISAIVWDPGTTPSANDSVVVDDASSRRKWSSTIYSGSFLPMPFTPSEPVISNGLTVPTLARGNLYIYLADRNNL